MDEKDGGKRANLDRAGWASGGGGVGELLEASAGRLIGALRSCFTGQQPSIEYFKVYLLPASCLNYRNQLRNNQLTQRALDSTANGVPTEWVGIVPVATGEVRVDWVAPRTPGSIHIKRPGHTTINL